MPFSRFIGYDRGADGRPVINEEEAKVVRQIYQLYLDGKSLLGIAKHLTQQGIPSPGGGKCWLSSTINSILSNEKYRGDALLQKNFTVDFLTKKVKKNEGEVQQYYVKNSHPAIISGEVFDLAQSERNHRRETGVKAASGNIVTGRIYCGECESLFGSKVWNSTNKYRRVVWRCNSKYGKHDKRGDGATHCTTPHVESKQIQAAFLKMLNGMLENKDQIIAFYNEVIASLTDDSALQAQKSQLQSDGCVIEGELREWIADNAHRAMSKEVYGQRYDELSAKLDEDREKLAKVNETILARSARRGHMKNVIELLKRDGLIDTFEDSLFGAIVNRVIVHSGRFVFLLKDGSEREVMF